MTSREALAAYSSDIVNLTRLLNEDKEADHVAYGSFLSALNIAWAGARKAARAYVEDFDPSSPKAKARKEASKQARIKRIAGVYCDAFRQGVQAKTSDSVEIERRANVYAGAFVGGDK